MGYHQKARKLGLTHSEPVLNSKTQINTNMKIKKQITIITFLCSFMLSIAFVEASPLEKATELMKIMDITKQIDATQAQMGSFAEKMVDSQGITGEKAQRVKSMAKKSTASSFEAMKSIGWDEMFAEIYASVFTEEELQALVDFYKSPIGKKFLEKQPELMAATMQKMQGEMAKIMPKIQADVMKAIQEAKQ